MDRYERAASQRMYLLDASKIGHLSWQFRVEGSRGVPYVISMNPQKSSCTCPDYFRRRQACKHILFISARVLKLPGYASVMTLAMDAALTELVSPKPKVVEQAVPTPEEPKDDTPVEGTCPICFEDFEPGNKCECCSTCKNPIHLGCLSRWLQQKQSCPLCRSPWLIKSLTAKGFMGEDEVLDKFRVGSGIASTPSSAAVAAASSIYSAGPASRISATSAKSIYRLTADDLAPLPYLTAPNPVNSNFAPVKLYLDTDIKRIADEKEREKSEVREAKAAKENAKRLRALAKETAARAKAEAKKREVEERKAKKIAEKVAAESAMIQKTTGKAAKSRTSKVSTVTMKKDGITKDSLTNVGKMVKPSVKEAQAKSVRKPENERVESGNIRRSSREPKPKRVELHVEEPRSKRTRRT